MLYLSLVREAFLVPINKGVRMGTNSSKNTFHGTNRGNPEGRGGSTHEPKGPVGSAALGTSSTHPISKTGKQASQGKS